MRACDDLDELRRVFSYDPQTGVLWRISGERNGLRADTTCSHGYRRLTHKKRQFLASRVAWALQTGRWPVGNHVDHIDGDKANNKWANLREATCGENGRNKRISAKNKTGAVGVYVDKRDGALVAQIKHNRRQTCLGRFPTLDEAAHARNKAAVLLHGEFAVLNPVGTDPRCQPRGAK